LAGLVHIDDPDKIVVAMTGFDQICDTLTDRTFPTWAANHNTNQWGIQLQHPKSETNGMPHDRKAGAGFISTISRCDGKLH
jgi:hypothetical protein